MRRILIVIAVFLPISLSAQWTVPVLAKDQARFVLTEMWPSYAMMSGHVSGPSLNWFTGVPINVIAPAGIVKFTLIESIGDSLTYYITKNDTARDTLGIRVESTRKLSKDYTGDSVRNLYLMVRGIVGNVALVGLAWMPVNFLWDDSNDDSVYAWVRRAVLTDIPAQYVSSNHDWRALDSILAILTPAQAALFERATKKVPADQIDMEAGSIFVSYNNSTQILTYLKRK